MPTTCASLMGSAFSKADLMCVFAALVGRNLVNRLSFTSSSRVGAVLIQMQLGSFRGCGIVVLGSCGGMLAATAAHDLARGVSSCRASASERKAWISSRSSVYWVLKSCCSALSSWVSALYASMTSVWCARASLKLVKNSRTSWFVTRPLLFPQEANSGFAIDSFLYQHLAFGVSL